MAPLGVYDRFDIYSTYIYIYIYMAVIATDYKLDGQVSIPGRKNRFFLYSTASRQDLRPTQPHIQWIPEALSRG
jgi:hypothetical protein